MDEVSGKHQGMKDTTSVAPAPRVRVLLPLPLAGAYDYRVPSTLALSPGEFVVVPLNHRDMIGVVWDSAEEPEGKPVADHRLRPVQAVLPAPPMTPSLRRFIDW